MICSTSSMTRRSSWWRGARVRGNKGARTAGVDGVAPRSIGSVSRSCSAELRDDLKAGRFAPQRVREKAIPKASGKIRRLGIPTTADRVVQAVVEAGARADLRGGLQAVFATASARDAERRTRSPRSTTSAHPLGTTSGCSRRTSRRASTRSTTPPSWAGCDDRVGDKRVLGWVKAFLRAGILTEEGLNRETITGTPQGGILSPLLANIALSVLDEHFAAKWEALGTGMDTRQASSPRRGPGHEARPLRGRLRGHGRTAPATDAEALWDEVAAVLAPMGLRLSEEKTRVCHIDEGFDFLGWRIQRRAWRGRSGKTASLHLPVEEDACVDHRQGADADPQSEHIERSQTCCAGSTRCCGAGATTSATACPRGPSATSITSPSGGSSAGSANDTSAEHAHPGPPLPSRLEDPRRRHRDVPAQRGRHRALPLPGHDIPTPWSSDRPQDPAPSGMNTWRAGCGESRTSGSEGGPEKPTSRKTGRALRPDPYSTP